MGEMDVEEIVAQIRSRVARGRVASTAEGPARAADIRREQMTADLETLQTAHDITRAPVVSHRPLAGVLLVALKRLLGALLGPFLGQQAVYNAANARFARDLADDVGTLDRRLESLARAHEEHGAALQWQLAALGDEWRAALRAEAAAREAETAARAAETAALQAETAAGQAALRDALDAEGERRKAVEERVRHLVDSLWP
jgi:hypothetical protein